MNFKTIDKYQGEESLIIIPILEQEKLSEKLLKIAEKYQFQLNGLENDLKTDLKSSQIIYTNLYKIAFVGLGKKFGEKDTITAFRLFFHKQKMNIKGIVGIDCEGFEENEIEFFVNGTLLGAYSSQFYKTDKKEETNWYQNNPNVFLYYPKNLQNTIERAEKIASSQANIMRLVDDAPNFITPETIANWAVESGRVNNFEVKVLNKKELQEQGFGLLLAVGNAGRTEPKLIIADYKPQKYTQTIGFVGKGITFDNGGVSIKDSTNMHFMKCDMSGAAAVLGLVEVVAKLKLPIRVISVVPTAENLLGHQAYLPADVITSYSGKTVEIIDTDAEGRLILADALTFLNRNYQPDTLIDVATLTGSVIAALGYSAAGLFTNNETIAQKLYESGQKTGEKLWRMPLWDDYKEDISSDIADLKNFSGKPIAGSISAGKFLEVFTENHSQYAHIDIAGVSFMDSSFASNRTATAFGVRLLLDYVEKL